jgi:hypothetical protein
LSVELLTSVEALGTRRNVRFVAIVALAVASTSPAGSPLGLQLQLLLPAALPVVAVAVDVVRHLHFPCLTTDQSLWKCSQE